MTNSRLTAEREEVLARLRSVEGEAVRIRTLDAEARALQTSVRLCAVIGLFICRHRSVYLQTSVCLFAGIGPFISILSADIGSFTTQFARARTHPQMRVYRLFVRRVKQCASAHSMPKRALCRHRSVYLDSLCFVALPTVTKVMSGTSRSRSGTSVNLSESRFSVHSLYGLFQNASGSYLPQVRGEVVDQLFGLQ